MDDIQFFAMVCFLALMQGNAGLQGKEKRYIKEKSFMLINGLDAWGFLDVNNQAVVRRYYDDWRLTLPKGIKL